MFVRTKVIRGQTYHYLVESQRVNGLPRQKVVSYLGHYQSVDEAVERLPKDITRLKRMRGRMQRSLPLLIGDDPHSRKLQSQIASQIASYEETILARSAQLELLKSFQVVPNKNVVRVT